MSRLRRKVDDYLLEWKKSKNKKPLIIKGARQIGKTESIENFGLNNYESFVEINFALEEEYKDIFESGFNVDKIISNISFKNNEFKFVPHNTLIFFDEIQDYPSAATSLKSFKIDGRFDVICSGSLMGINYQKIESNSVGNKIDFTMHSLDFEEFLWARGYNDAQIEEMYNCMKDGEPLTTSAMNAMSDLFREYMVVGGMPDIVNTFVTNKNYSGILDMQKQILLDYEEDITKYANGLDQAKILNAYRNIPIFLGKDNKKFQISKIADGARNREYIGVIDWLENAGIVNVSNALNVLELPLKGNYINDNYRLYFGDPGLLIASLDEESQRDLRFNKNFNTYKGAIYENVVADMLVKSGYELYFYKDDPKKIEMDFIIRDIDSVVPIEVKAADGSTISLNNLISNNSYREVKYGIKLCNKNIGFNGKFYTFPYFLTFLLKRFLNEMSENKIIDNNLE